MYSSEILETVDVVNSMEELRNKPVESNVIVTLKQYYEEYPEAGGGRFIGVVTPAPSIANNLQHYDAVAEGGYWKRIQEQPTDFYNLSYHGIIGNHPENNEKLETIRHSSEIYLSPGAPLYLSSSFEISSFTSTVTLLAPIYTTDKSPSVVFNRSRSAKINIRGLSSVVFKGLSNSEVTLENVNKVVFEESPLISNTIHFKNVSEIVVQNISSRSTSNFNSFYIRENSNFKFNVDPQIKFENNFIQLLTNTTSMDFKLQSGSNNHIDFKALAFGDGVKISFGEGTFNNICTLPSNLAANALPTVTQTFTDEGHLNNILTISDLQARARKIFSLNSPENYSHSLLELGSRQSVSSNPITRRFETPNVSGSVKVPFRVPIAEDTLFFIYTDSSGPASVNLELYKNSERIRSTSHSRVNLNPYLDLRRNVKGMGITHVEFEISYTAKNHFTYLSIFAIDRNNLRSALNPLDMPLKYPNYNALLHSSNLRFYHLPVGGKVYTGHSRNVIAQELVSRTPVKIVSVQGRTVQLDFRGELNPAFKVALGYIGMDSYLAFIELSHTSETSKFTSSAELPASLPNKSAMLYVGIVQENAV